MKKILRKLIVLFSSVIIFLPIILLLKIFNFFFEFRISKIPNDLGGIIVLYPYFIKKEKGYFKNKLHIFYISNIDRVYKNESLYNLFWLKCLFNHLSPVKIENKKLFFVYNKFWEFVLITAQRFNIKNFILILNDIHKKNKKSEKLIIKYYEEKLKPLVNINFSLKGFKLNNFSLEKNLISFVNRDPAYKKKQYPEMNMSYHDFRNFEVEDFRLAIKNFNKKNFSIIRMGNVTEKKLDIESSKYYDFSLHSNRTGELETFIISKSKFFVGPESGLDKIAAFFNIPIVYVNIHCLLWRPFFLNRCIFIPQKLKNLRNGKLFSFREMLNENFMKNNDNTPLRLYVKTTDYDDNNVKVINNTAEEINTAMEEMEFYLKNNFNLSQEDREIQNSFWKLFGDDYPVNKTHIISPTFLKKNIDLLNC